MPQGLNLVAQVDEGVGGRSLQQGHISTFFFPSISLSPKVWITAAAATVAPNSNYNDFHNCRTKERLYKTEKREVTGQMFSKNLREADLTGFRSVAMH